MRWTRFWALLLYSAARSRSDPVPYPWCITIEAETNIEFLIFRIRDEESEYRSAQIYVQVVINLMWMCLSQGERPTDRRPYTASMDLSLTQQWLNNQVKRYSASSQIIADVLATLQTEQSLKIKSDIFSTLAAPFVLSSRLGRDNITLPLTHLISFSFR